MARCGARPAAAKAPRPPMQPSVGAPTWRGLSLPGARRVEVAATPDKCRAALVSAMEDTLCAALKAEGADLWRLTGTVIVDGKALVMESSIFSHDDGAMILLMNTGHRDVVLFERAVTCFAAAVRDSGVDVVGMAAGDELISRLPCGPGPDLFDDYYAADELFSDEDSFGDFDMLALAPPLP
eukprot:CAMPEP_0170234696 /NCGR_PEP_ID=MMETSP0116_2-20130129/17093_1 /TAXON_ID=400756 /ORGANISM="Durinskia baltica, Strain CSIRO CS-38" /LENGTH=181 /DNA_ID=CAMNT_0010485489 /DNA_START=58 /DNA_END=603 /DNA_ORIENTATION=+